MRMVRAFVGIGSVDTVVAPDSALVGLAQLLGLSPRCRLRHVYCYKYTTYDVSVSSFAKIAYRQCAAQSSRYLYNEILAFYNNNVHLAKVSVH